jgi:putative two-component system response regulator
MGYQGAVLVVDDEIGPRESLRMILHPLYQVYTAADGEEALTCLQNQEIDLVTLDMKMPGISGLEVLKEIRRRNTEVDVIIISGYMNSQNCEEAKNYGAVDVISKPFNVTEVIASVGKSVERKKFNRKVDNLIETAKNLGAIDDSQINKILYN